jgi:hypothetical protein
LFGAGGIDERRPSTLPCIPIQSELGDSQNSTADIIKGKVHFALFVFKEADARDFLGQPIGFGLAVGVGDTDENDEPALYLADDTAVNGDMSLTNTLK